MTRSSIGAGALLSGVAAILAVGAAVTPVRAQAPENAPVASAEALLDLAQKNQLTDDLAAQAAAMLDQEDPFTRGMAEWAIAMKVGGENNGQEVRWPRPQSPPWYTAWTALSPAQRIEADWVRQAVAAGIHNDASRLLASVDQMIARTTRMAADLPTADVSAEVRASLAEQAESLQSVRRRLADQVVSTQEKGTGTFCAQHPEGRSGKRCLSPFPERRLWIEARRCLRRAALAQPAAQCGEIVFFTQFAPHTVRNITRSYPWKHKPGGDLCLLSAWQDEPRVRAILRGSLGPGHVRGADLDWDADRIVFAYARQPHWPPEVDTANSDTEGSNAFALRRTQEPIHLFRVGVDGSGPEQLTDDPLWSDFEPALCADGSVVFASDRCGRSPECGPFGHDHMGVNLYLRGPDGRIRQLTDSKDYDRYPHSLQNGQIVYTRWEYQERHFLQTHSLWTVRPDGAMADAIFKQHLNAPYGLRDARSIPQSNKLVAVATGHHTFAYGPVVIVDPAWGTNRVEGLRSVTPGVLPQEGPMAGQPVDQGGVADHGGLYQTPWALSETCFLAAYAYARPKCTASAGVDSNGFGLYLIDVYGNKELLYRDPVLSSSCPMPLRKRPRPPQVPGAADPAASLATCYVADVYQGMESVPRGTIKYLRIAQHVGWPYQPQRGAMPYLPSNAYQDQFGFWSWSPVRVIGTVPVEADGSVSFRVPADTALYFQALDERHMEIRRMRSMVSLKAGEVRGCTGCHESRATAPPFARGPSLAQEHDPRIPTPPAWGAERLLGYPWLVQPILDRHCVRCHGSKAPEGGLDFTGTLGLDGFCQSFRTMFGRLPGAAAPGRKLVACSDRFSNADVTRVLQFGSHQSPLVRVLLDDELHRKEARLDEAEWVALVTWVDANAPYYDGFVNKRPAEGGPPRREPYQAPPAPLAANAESL